MIRPIVTWPDPVLATVCGPVKKITDDIRALAEDMLETMYAAPGRGLAAPQIGVPLRLFVMDTVWKEAEPAPRIMVNPRILQASEARVRGVEGCLSIPGVTAEVERHAVVTMTWQSIDGEACEETFDGFDAICAQHELDHLDGIVTFDRVPSEVRASLEREYLA